MADDDTTIDWDAPIGDVRKRWETESKALKDKVSSLEAEVPTLRRENAFFKAELGTLSESQRKAVLAVAGDDVTAEALTTAAADLGFVTARQQTADESADAQARVAAAATGGSAPGSQTMLTKGNLHTLSKSQKAALFKNKALFRELQEGGSIPFSSIPPA